MYDINMWYVYYPVYYSVSSRLIKQWHSVLIIHCGGKLTKSWFFIPPFLTPYAFCDCFCDKLGGGG
jgi:hypothetical protein